MNPRAPFQIHHIVYSSSLRNSFHADGQRGPSYSPQKDEARRLQENRSRKGLSYSLTMLMREPWHQKIINEGMLKLLGGGAFSCVCVFAVSSPCFSLRSH